ncbi:unnamed protein product [Periconia digitata]|uniref:Eukaryotic translation initiation factor 3 subunit E n=1 Tax=Periconia digitata TaxID=1303443 RepID=A0A9W4UKV9_9PLEO|nr:unnamed protein product [Periconia digitata]
MAAPTANGDSIAEQYNLLPKLMQHLDRHLIYPLLSFNPTEEELSIDRKKVILELLKPTNMADFTANLHQEINGLSDISDEFKTKRDQVLKRRDQLEEDTSKLSALLDDESVVTNLRSDKVQNLAYLKEQHGVTVEMVNKLFEQGQFQYGLGDYGYASELLTRFRILTTDNDKEREASWGKLACEILSANWESALDDITKLAEHIDGRLINNPLAQLQQRTWLIHWSLFPLFNDEKAREALTDRFFGPTYINTIQTSCPWVLRYLAAAVVTNRARSRTSNPYQKQLKDLIRIVRQEGYEYSDPVTDFIKALYIDFDFEEAQKKLGETEEILKNDFFLLGSADAFVDSARHLISESYCKIHQRIDIKDLSTRLGLSQDEGEKWIVNLIRDTRVDAKIDYQAGTVVMNHPPQSVYQQVIERTKGGFFRTQVLSAAVAK